MLRKDKFSSQQKVKSNPTHRGKIFGTYFFYLKKKVKQISPEQKSTWGHIIFIHKSDNEIVDKIVFISLKAGQK